MRSMIVVADTPVLINFLRIDRMDLIDHHPERFLATHHVEAEITSDYPDQRMKHSRVPLSRSVTSPLTSQLTNFVSRQSSTKCSHHPPR
jgi:predicted nucleic acid-binding protein